MLKYSNYNRIISNIKLFSKFKFSKFSKFSKFKFNQK